MSKNKTMLKRQHNRRMKPRRVKNSQPLPAGLETLGNGVGIGHGGNTPDMPVIRKMPEPPHVTSWKQRGLIEQQTDCYKAGKLTIMVSFQPETGWHMSISRNDRYPYWDEIAYARYELLPQDMTFVFILPPREEYINVHNFCFHLHEYRAAIPAMPPTAAAEGESDEREC